MLRRICGALLALGFASAPAASQAIESTYTRFDAKACRHTPGREEEDYGSWRCPGYGKLRMTLAAGDQRMYVTYGGWKTDDIARSQTFPAFNDVYSGTVEWRIERKPDGTARPFATILRWNVILPSDNEKATGPVKANGHVLVVTRLGPGGVCHVGYVDATANKDANELARQLADAHARRFKCGKDKRIVSGKVGEVAMPRDDDE